jgi:dihydrofolate reductase
MSLDGYIAESDDNIDWLMGFPGVEPGPAVTTAEGGVEEFYEEIDTLVMGSVTYEWVLEHAESWPYPTKPSWILSSRELPVPEGADVTVTNASVPELFEQIPDGTLWVVGGGNVASQFADAGLLDQVWVTVVPVVLGTGKPLFDRRVDGLMRPTEVLPRPSGMIELRFEMRRET